MYLNWTEYHDKCQLCDEHTDDDNDQSNASMSHMKESAEAFNMRSRQ